MEHIKVHSYESMGTYDGPGIRLVVFLQGCQFHCLYCANPDTIDISGGKSTDPEEILKMAVSQKPFFAGGGGVTFSGGEPTLQARALVPLVRMLHAEGIHVCIDTNGGVRTGDAEELLSLTDLVLLDIKQISPIRHKSLTGRDNAPVLETARYLEDNSIPFRIRYVLVPGYSDAEEDIRALGEHFKDYKMIRQVDILPYHTLGAHKWKALGKKYALEDVPLNTKEQLSKAKSLFEEFFPNVVLN